MKYFGLIISLLFYQTANAGWDKDEIKPAFEYSMQELKVALGFEWDVAYKLNYVEVMDSELLLYTEGTYLFFNDELNTDAIKAGANLRHELNGEWLFDSIQYAYLKAYHESDQQFEARNLSLSLSYYIGQIEILPNQLELPSVRFGAEYVFGQDSERFIVEDYVRYILTIEHSLHFSKFDSTQALDRFRIKTRFDYSHSSGRNAAIKAAGLVDSHKLSVALYYSLSDDKNKPKHIPWDVFIGYEGGRSEPTFENDDKIIIGVKYGLQ
ncbi:MAG: hypothetical protein ACSHX4_11635 [Opitutaceae bacterium]